MHFQKLTFYSQKSCGWELGKKDTGNYQYIRVRYSLDGELQARPLNSEKTVWTLTNTTVSGNYGDGTNFFFYDEELDLSENIKSSIPFNCSDQTHANCCYCYTKYLNDHNPMQWRVNKWQIGVVMVQRWCKRKELLIQKKERNGLTLYSTHLFIIIPLFMILIW